MYFSLFVLMGQGNYFLVFDSYVYFSVFSFWEYTWERKAMKDCQAPAQESQNHRLIQAGRHPWGHLTGYQLTAGLTSKLGGVAQGLDQLNFENVQDWKSTASLPCSGAMSLSGWHFLFLYLIRVFCTANCKHCVLYLPGKCLRRIWLCSLCSLPISGRWQ